MTKFLAIWVVQATVGCRLDGVGLEDFPESGGHDFDSQGGEFAVDSPVASTGIVARRVQDESWNATDGGTLAGLSGARGPGVAATQKVVVPAQDGVGGDDQAELSQC